MDAVLDLVRSLEEQMAEGFDEELRRYETAREAAEASREAWQTNVKTAVAASDLAPPCPAEAEIPDRPVQPRMRAADATTEKLGALAAGLPRGLLLVRDELAGWFGNFDRYGGSGADRAFGLEMYGGRSYAIDRMRHPEPLRIRHLSIGVLGGIQPERLAGVLEGADDGLLSRVLWSWPEPLPHFTLGRDHLDNRAAYSAFERLAALRMDTDEFGRAHPRLVPLTADAERTLERFAQEMHVRTGAAFGPLAGVLGKARGQALRLSAILEFLWWCSDGTEPEPEAISVQAVRAAAALMDEYFLPMAERVLGDAALPVVDRNATILARHLKSRRRSMFNARDLRREVGGSLREAKAMEEACKVLEEAGLIRPRSRASQITGRRAQNYDVHPAVHGDRP